MIYLILCILSSTGIFFVFKILDFRSLPPFPVIVINYLVAATLGFAIHNTHLNYIELIHLPWIPISFLIGFLFIMLFFVVALSSQKAGISVTSVAGKMSVVFPIAFSIIIEPADKLSLLKAVAILTALIGVFLTVYQPDSVKSKRDKMYIPLLLFVGMGVVDSLVKYAQHSYVEDSARAIFSAMLFSISFLTGILILPFKAGAIKSFRTAAVWIWGVILGLFNFGSVYFMVSALNHLKSDGSQIDSSIIFGTNNIGIVTLSVLLGLILFSEKLSPANWTGILLSIAAIMLFLFS